MQTPVPFDSAEHPQLRKNFMWGFDYNFTKHDLKQHINVQTNIWPEGCSTRVYFLNIKGFSESIVGEIVVRSPYTNGLRINVARAQRAWRDCVPPFVVFNKNEDIAGLARQSLIVERPVGRGSGDSARRAPSIIAIIATII